MKRNMCSNPSETGLFLLLSLIFACFERLFRVDWLGMMLAVWFETEALGGSLGHGILVDCGRSVEGRRVVVCVSVYAACSRFIR